MSLAGVGGTITTVVGLGITLGALGLAFEFADRAIDRTSGNGKRRATKRKPLFDTGFGNGGSRTSKRRNNNDIFSIPGQKRSSGKRSNNVFGGELF